MVGRREIGGDVMEVVGPRPERQIMAGQCNSVPTTALLSRPRPAVRAPPSPWMARSIGVGGRPVTLARVKPIQPEPPERNRCSALRRWALTPARTVQSGRDVRTSCSLAGALPSAAAGEVPLSLLRPFRVRPA